MKRSKQTTRKNNDSLWFNICSESYNYPAVEILAEKITFLPGHETMGNGPAPIFHRANKRKQKRKIRSAFLEKFLFFFRE